MTSIILVGPRCTGKTEKGEILASLRRAPFVDADNVFSILNEMSISDFVKINGWPAFRKAEAETLSEIALRYSNHDTILAPGGGAVAHDQSEKYRIENVNLLRSFGQIVYILPTGNLEESARILVDRMNKDSKSAGQRPSLTQAKSQYEEMLQTRVKRDPLYRAAAHHTFYTRDMTSAQAAWCINDLVR